MARSTAAISSRLAERLTKLCPYSYLDTTPVNAPLHVLHGRFVETEVMAELVQHGAPDLLAQLRPTAAVAQQGAAEDGDHVGGGEQIAAAALGEWDAAVDAEQRPTLLVVAWIGVI